MTVPIKNATDDPMTIMSCRTSTYKKGERIKILTNQSSTSEQDSYMQKMIFIFST